MRANTEHPRASPSERACAAGLSHSGPKAAACMLGEGAFFLPLPKSKTKAVKVWKTNRRRSKGIRTAGEMEEGNISFGRLSKVFFSQAMIQIDIFSLLYIFAFLHCSSYHRSVNFAFLFYSTGQSNSLSMTSKNSMLSGA